MPSLWYPLYKNWQKRQLRLPQYRDLFDEPQNEYISLDCETTSLNKRTAELLSIGAVKIINHRILTSEALYLVVQPNQMLQPQNIRIHGLRPKDVKEGVSPQQAIETLLDFIGGRTLIGYYLEFDIAILNRYIKPWLGTGLPQRKIEISGQYYDYKLRQNPNAYIDLRLDALCTDLAVPTLPRHHALNDAINAAMLYLVLQHRINR